MKTVEFQKMNDVAKEVNLVLQNIDTTLMEKIPKNFIKTLEDMAEKSNKKVQINFNKDLKEQEISEEAKDLIAVIYYRFIANEVEKKRIFELWNTNEREYQEALIAKYDSNNIFKKNSKISADNTNVLPVEVKKVSLIEKIIKFINKIFRK